MITWKQIDDNIDILNRASIELYDTPWNNLPDLTIEQYNEIKVVVDRIRNTDQEPVNDFNFLKELKGL